MIQVTPDKVVTIGTVFLLLGLPCSSGEFKQHTHGENKGTQPKKQYAYSLNLMPCLCGFQYSRKYHKWGIGIGSSPIGYEGFVQPQKGQDKAKLNEYYNYFCRLLIYTLFIHLFIYQISFNIPIISPLYPTYLVHLLSSIFITASFGVVLHLLRLPAA